MPINDGLPGQVPQPEEQPKGVNAANSAREEGTSPEAGVFTPGDLPAAPKDGDPEQTPFVAQLPAGVTPDDLDSGVEVGNTDHDVSGGKAQENKENGVTGAFPYGQKLWALVRNGFVEVVRASGNAFEHPFAAHEVRMRDEDTQPVRVIDVTGAQGAEHAAGYIVDNKGNIAPSGGRTKPLAPHEPAYHDRDNGGTRYTSMENSQKFATSGMGVGAEDDGGSAVVSPEDDTDPLLGEKHESKEG